MIATVVPVREAVLSFELQVLSSVPGEVGNSKPATQNLKLFIGY